MKSKSVPMGTRFTPVDDFFSPELSSHYVDGLIYTVRAGDAKLAAMVPIWVGENKVTLGGSGAKLQGSD